MLYQTLLFIILSIQIHFVISYPTGPPPKSCMEFVPKHGFDPQQTQAPYNIQLNPTTYTPGDTITVTLNGMAGATFKGFILVAHRLTGDTEADIGNFIDLDATNVKPLKWYPEIQNETSCVSHSNPSEKSTLSVKWQSPAKSVGSIIFTATFVQSFNKFWINVKSSKLRTLEPNTDPVFPSLVNRQVSSFMIPNECGKSWGCIFYPKHCSGDDCVTIFGFKKVADTMHFEIIAETVGYIAIGFSDDQMMGKDQTHICTWDEKDSTNFSISVQNGYNPAQNNAIHRIINITNIGISRKEKKILCQFQRPIKMSLSPSGDFSSDSVVFDLNTPMYVFLANGKLYPGSHVASKHSELPAISTAPVDFSSVKIVNAVSVSSMIKAHGIVMVFAWILFAVLGSVTAAFFKETFNIKLCNIASWFHIHRPAMVLLYVLSITGIIIIFVHLKAWSDVATAHGALGLLAIGFATLQLIGGMARPDVAAPKRKYFNILHKLGGYSTQIFAVVCLFLMTTIPILPSKMRQTIVIILACWISFVLLWMLIFFIMNKKLQNISKNKTHDNNEMESEHSVQSKDAEKFKKILKIGYIIYVIGLGAFTITMIYFISIY